jgi:hypothetical protein
MSDAFGEGAVGTRLPTVKRNKINGKKEEKWK